MRTPTLTPGQVKAIPLRHLKADPAQIRKTFDPSKLRELGNSLKVHGQQQPIVVRKNGSGYIVEKGERRLRAAKLAKLSSLNCVLATDLTGEDADFQRLVSQYAENTYREDLNPIDMGEFFKSMRDEYGFKTTEMPAVLKDYGIKKPYSDSYIRNLIRLTELPAWVQGPIRSGQLTQKHGRAIAQVAKHDKAMAKLEKTLGEELKKRESGDHLDPLDSHDIVELVTNACKAVYPTAHTYQVDYDLEKLPAEKKKALNIVEVDNGYGWKQPFITNLELHQELTKKAHAQKSTTSTSDNATDDKTPEKKADKPVRLTASSPDRLQQWVHLQLLAWINTTGLPALEASAGRQFTQAFITWLAAGTPGAIAIQPHWRSSYSGELFGAQQSGAKDLKIGSLDLLLACSPEALGNYQAALQDFLLQRLDVITALRVARFLGFNIDKDIRIDAEFVRLYTGDGALNLFKGKKLTQAEQVALDEHAGKTTGDKRKLAIKLAEKIGTPAEVKKFWHAELKRLK